MAACHVPRLSPPVCRPVCACAPSSACLSLTLRTERVHVCLPRAPDPDDSALFTGGVNGRGRGYRGARGRSIHTPRGPGEAAQKGGVWRGVRGFIVNYFCGVDPTTGVLLWHVEHRYLTKNVYNVKSIKSRFVFSFYFHCQV